MKPNTGPTRRQFGRQFVGAIGSAVAVMPIRPLFSVSTNDGYIHLNFNESPYGPSDRTWNAIRDSISLGGRYPLDLSYDNLKTQIVKISRPDRRQRFDRGGFHRDFESVRRLFLQSKPHLVVADATYDAVYQYAVNSHSNVTKVPLTSDHRHDLDKMAAAVRARHRFGFHLQSQ